MMVSACLIGPRSACFRSCESSWRRPRSARCSDERGAGRQLRPAARLDRTGSSAAALAD